MRPAIFFSGMLLVTSLTPALAADPTGDWQVADGVANIRVAQCNGNMWGAVAWEKEPGGVDEHNPDVTKRSRPTLGIAVLSNMKKKSGVDQWEGEVYNAENGATGDWSRAGEEITNKNRTCENTFECGSTLVSTEIKG